MRSENKAPIEQCPHCGSDDGFYTKEQVSGTVNYMYNFDGKECDNGSMYENLSHKGGKVAYCLKCDKKLFNMSVLDE